MYRLRPFGARFDVRITRLAVEMGNPFAGADWWRQLTREDTRVWRRPRVSAPVNTGFLRGAADKEYA